MTGRDRAGRVVGVGCLVVVGLLAGVGAVLFASGWLVLLWPAR